MVIDRDELLRRLVEIQYERNDFEQERGSFRVRGDVVEIIPAASNEKALRIELFGDEIERIAEVEIVSGHVLRYLAHVMIFPASHYATSRDKLERCIENIENDLNDRFERIQGRGKTARSAAPSNSARATTSKCCARSATAPASRTIPATSDGRAPGEAPFTLLDYFPKDFILFIDESHATIPQIRAMYNGDAARKRSLVDYGFRLPAAFDNRPLKFHEFEQRVAQAIYVSATPGPYEMERAEQVVEQIIRPTGLLDPEIVVRQPPIRWTTCWARSARWRGRAAACW